MNLILICFYQKVVILVVLLIQDLFGQLLEVHLVRLAKMIYSSNGNVLLIEKGSKLFGTYKGDQANDGTSRYFVVWQEVRTLHNI